MRERICNITSYLRIQLIPLFFYFSSYITVLSFSNLIWNIIYTQHYTINDSIRNLKILNFHLYFLGIVWTITDSRYKLQQLATRLPSFVCNNSFLTFSLHNVCKV